MSWYVRPHPTGTRTVHRIRIPIGRPERFELPATMRILHVASRTADSLDLWYELPVGDVEVREAWLVIVGTGHQIDPGYEHLGTGLAADGRLVWHLYGADVGTIRESAAS